ncbi:hypothetical protein F5B22DRAFT_271080 [Xylaria bambusicola]|uniref:uncharacterized protein n=1 Tax=Xylaria bambusicola TaxID=326684 RepID=UPI002008505E|nr:uncharacterized protein F5B22DRAFT_271080 [Xylaria bambusicola]KAI0526144.1 hypothetical protein F5B22DRAFT_271080 [Xylaria bambusicola]
MMITFPFITPALPIAARGDCTQGTVFYHCGNFEGCCKVDPCAYRNSPKPCDEALDQQSSKSHESTKTEEHTQTTTTTLPDFTTRDPETDTETETSTTSDPDTSTSSQSSTHIGASTTTATDGTTLSTSVASTSSFPSSATRTLPAPLPTNSSSSDDSGLPNGTIAGISVISAIGVIVFLTSFFWYARRRRLSKRMSSLRGSSPTPMESPSMGFDFEFNTGRRGGGDSPAPPPPPPAPETRAGCSELYTPGAHPGNAQQMTVPEIREPEPTHAELDSSETQRPNLGVQTTQAPDTTALPPPGRPSLPSAAGQLHPPLLTPGFRGGSIQSNRDSSNLPWVQPRATLNATEDERMNKQYANSWATGP